MKAQMMGITTIGVYLDNTAMIPQLTGGLLSGLACMASLLAFYFTPRNQYSQYLVYAFSFLQGCGD
jgi:hypothetical protein